MHVKTIKHEGMLLKEHLKRNNISKQEVCGKLNISKAMLSYYFRKEILSKRFKAKLSAIGITRIDVDHEKEVFSYPSYNELKDEIALLNQVISLQKEFITHITRNCRNGICLNFVFDRSQN